jgi:hypothetical protein
MIMTIEKHPLRDLFEQAARNQGFENFAEFERISSIIEAPEAAADCEADLPLKAKPGHEAEFEAWLAE